MTRTSIRLLSACCAALLAAPAAAQPIPVANHSFQLPDPGGDGNADDEDAYDVGNGNPAPSNWTLVNTANGNYGQARPDPDNQFSRDVTGGETSPFTLGGFDGDLILFANMNGVGESLTATSDVVGQVVAGRYKLTVAVGGRDTGSWNDLNYAISLVGSASGVLGTSSARIDPGASANNTVSSSFTTDEYNVVDLSLLLDVAGGSPWIGEDLSIQVYAENSGLKGGVAATSFTQAAIDNVRLSLVPEPASMILASLGAALAGHAVARRRRS